MNHRDPRYDILFEPVNIGPVTAKNRFYQVPHCTGMGWVRPRMVAEMRGIKAEGGWGVVCTEYCSIHPSSDDIPTPSHALWDKGDVRSHRLMTDKVHAHGALAGVELWVSGSRSSNLMSREPPRDVASIPNWNGQPVQSRAMDKRDIKDLRRWHRQAALRAKEAGFDIVYVYATHQYLLDNFLDPVQNTRTDEYGGSRVNRMRILREIIEDTQDAVGDTCAIAIRYALDDGGGGDGSPIFGERMEIFEELAEVPDLWDINVRDYSLEMGSSRFVKEGALEDYMSMVKSMTTKPVVTVGRFTSPDTMVGQVKRGAVDFIGCARPSIADPFLPKKIEEGRLEDIRECIGCNVCYTGDTLGYPLRCTQNPTMGEEWRRGWHPEKIALKKSNDRVLVVGAGPTGLEAAVALGKRGYEVMLAEATRELGGRVTGESALPGLSEWARVRDYRVGQLNKLLTVDVYRESELALAEVLNVGADHVAVATGAAWRRDGYGKHHTVPIPQHFNDERVFTPEDIMAGTIPQGRTIVFDDDSYYLGAVIAEKLCLEGLQVVYVTPSAHVSQWTLNSDEQYRVHKRLAATGAEIVLNTGLESFDGNKARLACVYTEEESTQTADSVVMVTCRTPRDTLYHALVDAMETGVQGAPKTVQRIGDADSPSIIAAAVYAGHKYARELDEQTDPDVFARQDRVFYDEA